LCGSRRHGSTAQPRIGIDAFMLRFLVRFAGLLLLAGGFAALIVDGTRSIAAGSIQQSLLGQTIQYIAPAKFDLIEPAVRRLHPLLWDPVLTHLFQVPTWGILALCGLVLLYLARPSAPKIGFSSRP
jgi:hypothetical protein